MLDFNNRKPPATRGEAIAVYGFIAFFLLMIALEIIVNYEPRKLAALFFILWWMPLVFLHELGHAMMARAVGWSVERTVIGFGKQIFEGRLFGAPLTFHLVPLEGFVRFDDGGSPSRIKHALTYFAGPGIELLLFFLILLGMGAENFFLIEDAYGKLALQALAYAALVGAVINLIPMGVDSENGHVPNDGMGILLSLFGKRG